MGEEHPVIWYQHLGPANAPIFYTALGHFSHFYNGEGPHHIATILRAGLKFVGGDYTPNPNESSKVESN